MVSRVVFGCGTVGTAIVESVADWRGRLRVLSGDESRVETLRSENIAAELADLTDPETVRNYDRPVDVAVVAGDVPETNLAVARAVAERFPDAPLIVYTGKHPDPEITPELEALADHLVDPGRALVGTLAEMGESDAGIRTRALRKTIRAVDGKLGVFMHDNPDPDAIASAIALVRLAESVGVEAEPCYFGDISHQENRAFVNLLELELRNVGPDLDLSEFAGIALVDHSIPSVNDQLPEGTEVDVVVDHHPPKLPVEAKFIDLRGEVGATSTLMANHLGQFGGGIDTAVATALLYGIRVDTKDFTREVSQADFEAAAFLLPHADTGVLERVETPSMSRETLSTIGRAIRNRELDGEVLASCVGAIADRDALAQAADRLLTMEGVTTTLVYGFMDGTIYVSARSRGADLDLGEALRDAFGQIGSAGGHADMAGAQIPLGLLGEVADEEEASLTDVVRGIINDRFFEVVASRIHRRGNEGGDEESGFDLPVAAGEGAGEAADPDESR